MDNKMGYLVRVGTEERVAFARCAWVQTQAPVEVVMEAQLGFKASPLVIRDQKPEGVRTHSMEKLLLEKLKEEETSKAAIEEDSMPSILPPVIPHEMDMEEWAWGAGGAEW